ncbi:patatin-like phospholipase family protein [Tepidibacillus fermentans]|uniref:Putative patatin/cPLA2 family phospholipase n=1 Tax=Tepidibacillus fermentans TaxID=1281767 RepID=A0A4R3KL54_9BACI|nr:patatin family protein [Tepidibacillus fermentans]TCS84467.1 putative patatin/cPLA2 family phospholipase [Tepidibacillus fermentans]
MEGVGLVLEGGGMRGVYTAGVLEFFMEQDLYFPYVIGVSAGACNACSYISRQKGRNKRVTIDYVNDPRYLSYRNLWKEKSIFGMDFIFDEIPKRLDPFDFETFNHSKQRFIVGTTDVFTGKPVYFDRESVEDVLQLVRASSSLPFAAPTVHIDGYTLLDGGIADPIPIRKSIKDGNLKNVIVLTRNRGYRKRPFKYKWLAKRKYPRYQGLIDAMVNRHQVYNETLDFIKQLEEEKKAFVIRPSQPLSVKRTEKDQKKLEELYHQGYEDAKKSYIHLKRWIEN